MNKKTFNVFNITIILVIVILVALISVRYYTTEPQKDLHFSGPNIYRAVYAYEVIHEQGFEASLYFEGKWVDSGELIEGRGMIIAGEDGTFTIEYDKRELTIGGPTSSSEQIAATKVVLYPAHSDIIKVKMGPQRIGNFDSLIKKLDRLADRLVPEENIYNIGFEGDIMIDTELNLKPTIVQELDNILKQGNEVDFYESGLRISLKNADLSDLENIRSLLDQRSIEVSNIATSRLVVLIRSKQSIKGTDNMLFESIAHDIGVYSLKIIKKPL